MNKDQLATELKQKLKLGIKPSDLKKPQPQSVSKPISPSPISIDKKPQPKFVPKAKSPPSISIKDEGYESDKSNQSIPTAPPLPTSQLLALNKQIEIQQAIKKADEKQKHELAEKVKVLETKLSETQEKLKTIIQLASQEKEEFKQKIKELQSQALQANSTENPVKEPLKTFLCSDCQQTQPTAQISRIFGQLTFCLTCSKKARQQAQTQKTLKFTCHTCQKEKQEIPAKMKLDKS